MWLQLHDVNKRFTTPKELKQQLVESLGERVPPESAIDTFEIGYLVKPSQTKQWIVSAKDLELMYAQSSGEDISLWCDKRLEAEDTNLVMQRKRSSTADIPSAKRQSPTAAAPGKKQSNYAQREDEIESLASELEEKHGDQYSFPQYKLWARLIKNWQHSDKDLPLNVP